MDHSAHISFVDAHAKRVGRHHYLRISLHEPVLGGSALVRRHAGVIPDSEQPLGPQPLADVLDLAARAAVDDRGSHAGVRERQ